MRTSSGAARFAAPGYALALTLVIGAPLLGPGYLLLRDAVSTPRSYLSDAALGLTEAAPRALPQDFAVALASHLLDGGVVVKALLLGALCLAGWGAARLSAQVLPEAGLAGQCVAVTMAIWNPYVAERLLQGHWSLLVGYGCLPWVATTLLRLRVDESVSWWAAIFSVLFWMALAGLTPTGLMLAAIVGVVCAIAPGPGRQWWRCAALVLGAAVVAALPWLTAAAVSGSLTSSQGEGIEAFAARAEPGLGTLGSLASLGGIWNSEAVPGSRTTFFAVLAAVVLLGVVATGLTEVVCRPAAVPLILLAAVAVALPAAMATGPGLAAVQGIIDTVPGLGVIRDAQKWVALAVPGYALAGAGAVIMLRRWVPSGGTALACCAALLVTLPDLAWGVGGKIAPVHYPPGWAAAAAVIDADPGPVAVLPADILRRFTWSGTAPVLDPLPRWVRASVLSTGDLTISGETIPGEGRRARNVQRLLLAGADRDALARAGVGWVVVEEPSEPTALALPVAYHDDDLTVYRIGGDRPPAAHRRVLLTAHLVWLAMLTVGGVGMAVVAVKRRR